VGKVEKKTNGGYTDPDQFSSLQLVRCRGSSSLVLRLKQFGSIGS